MKRSVFKHHLTRLTEINILKPDGTPVPRHFHITEAGLLTKNFIDCGGTIRTDQKIVLQVWVASDYHHRLEPQKLGKIIQMSENLFGNQDLEIEIEYQTETICRYGLDFDGTNFLLIAQHTDCLAKGLCDVGEAKHPETKPHRPHTIRQTACTPGGGCC